MSFLMKLPVLSAVFVAEADYRPLIIQFLEGLAGSLYRDRDNFIGELCGNRIRTIRMRRLIFNG